MSVSAVKKFITPERPGSRDADSGPATNVLFVNRQVLSWYLELAKLLAVCSGPSGPRYWLPTPMARTGHGHPKHGDCGTRRPLSQEQPSPRKAIWPWLWMQRCLLSRLTAFRQLLSMPALRVSLSSHLQCFVHHGRIRLQYCAGSATVPDHLRGSFSTADQQN